MASVRVLKMAYRQYRRGNPKPLRFVWGIISYGLMHLRCKRCRKVEWPRMSYFCKACREENLLRVLETEAS